ncbi:hypothetical protein BCR36DRAFT_583705 [Piromyces finnis]|uniref:Uncharacterized protein n=1 Tax=Piromyces finnis TaxID=1754191 RepID=A0A1Y1V895_9FUNG|nr:hypothetical protein BCR36DRAFT_583705 [Piromyces finnis]|eukprot:ORX49631.1 hypothetical protein BCR36DRAFT_583705 [Piromyces finnis]
MKFQNILTLFFLTKVFANNIPGHLERRDELNESDIGMVTVCDQDDNCQYLYEDPTNINNKECSIAVYTECNVTTFFNINTIDDICMNYDPVRCQNLLNNEFSSIPACTNKNQIYLQKLRAQIEESHTDLQIFCSKDAGGNLCPYTLMTLTEFPDYLIDINVITSENLVMESCKAKGCSETLPKIIEWVSKKNIDNTLNYNNLYKQMTNYINSDKCTSIAQVKPFTGSATANSNTQGRKKSNTIISNNNENSDSTLNNSNIQDESGAITTTNSIYSIILLNFLFLLFTLMN